MKPDWLTVPAAEWRPCTASVALDDRRGRTRLLLVGDGDWLRGGTACDAGTGSTRLRETVDCDLSWPGGPWALEWRSGCDVEYLDPGRHAHEHTRVTASGRTRRPRGCNAQVSALDKHRLDVALSMGRHAVERAKLADRGRVMAIGQRLCGAPYPAIPVREVGMQPTTGSEWLAGVLVRSIGSNSGPAALYPGSAEGADFYGILARLGSLPCAALVGAAVAAGQIGMPMVLRNGSARMAGRIARGLCPDISPWLVDVDPSAPRPRKRAMTGTERQSPSEDVRTVVLAECPF